MPATSKDARPVGTALLARRRALRLSRARLAGLAGCSPAYIATLEGGYSPAHSAVIEQLVAALDAAEAEQEAA